MHKLRAQTFAFTLLLLLVVSVSATAQSPRVIITADPELDDANSLIRALLYTPDIRIEGLVYASSGVHWKGDGKGGTQYIPGREYTRMGLCPCTSWRWDPNQLFIDDIVAAYAKAYPNLKIHDPGFTSPGVLKSKIMWGNVDFDGDYSKDTDGSNLIKTLVLDSQPDPVYVTAQAGHSTVARALKSIYDQYSKTPQWETIRAKVARKLVIIPWGDQDGTYARYIRPNWPEVANWQLNMINFGYGIRAGLTPENQVYISPAWTQENIVGRGPLGAQYYVWGDGKQMHKGDKTDYFGLTGLTADQMRQQGYNVWTAPQEKGSFISEGDTPTFMNLLNNGLRAWENSGYAGGWGGIRRPAATTPPPANVNPASPDDPGVGIGVAPAGSTANVPPPAPAAAPGRGPGGGRGAVTISPKTAAVNARFFAAAQNDFAARMKWSVSPKFRDANHAPKVTVKGSLELTAKPGANVSLAAQVSDPDGDKVRTTWWQYNDAGTYPGDITLADPAALATTFTVPADATPGQTIHVILEATDQGTPALTRYQRVIIRVN